MNLKNRFLRLPCITASIALILFSAFLPTAAQTIPPGNEKVFSFSDFNPAGDGVADDGPALQRALNALADAGGGTLLIPAGSYRIVTPVVKDFSAISGAKITIQGVPSSTMPAPVTALGHELAAGLNLTSEIIPATGEHKSAITLSNLHNLLIEHVGFSGTPSEATDAYVTVSLSDIDQATIRHCEFYGISSFGWLPDVGGGNIISAVRSALSIELSVFLGCTADSGAYAPVVQNLEWRKFSISNSIFLDYGLRAFFSKTGLGAPLSWINIGNAAATTPESPRREVVIRDVFLDEGGWVGISALPYRYVHPSIPLVPIDLIYISGLKMNVSNLATTGHLLYDARNLLIENSHYGWSHNSYSALHINRFENVILDKLTCIDSADRIMADDHTERLTVINSVYTALDSLARTTTVMETSPEQDPVQYVRKQFVTVLGRQPDPAAHFYWSDLLIKCGTDNDCLNQQRSELSDYLGKNPQSHFALAGTVTDEDGNPLSGAEIRLTGSQSIVAMTDSQGNFRFSGLPTSGVYNVAVNKRHYSFTTSNQSVARPTDHVTVVFSARLNLHSVGGRITKADGTGISGITLQLGQSPAITATTDSNGFYSFGKLTAGEDYTVLPSSNAFVFFPDNTTFDELSADGAANFVAKVQPELLIIEESEFAIALDAIGLMAQPFSIFNSLGFRNDEFIRVMVFAKNLETISSPSQVSVVAKDDQGQTYPLEIEFMGEVAGQSWLKQLNLKLPSNSLNGKCVQLKLSVAEVNSNDGRICIANVTSSPNPAK